MAHLSFQELAVAMTRAKAQIKAGGVYVHFKNPDSRYEVLGFTILEATDEVAVRYRSLAYPEVEFSRVAEDWLQQIDGMPRFRLLDGPQELS